MTLKITTTGLYEIIIPVTSYPMDEILSRQQMRLKITAGNDHE